MKPAKTIFFAALVLTAMYLTAKVLGGAVQAVPSENPIPQSVALCVTCGKPSQVSTKSFPTLKKENLKLLEERLNALYPKQ